MAEKKNSNNDLIEAISLKFGSVEAYATYKETSKQNIYNKIGRQAKKFLIELRRDGVDLSLGKGLDSPQGNNIENEKFNPLGKEVNDLKELLILTLKENKGLKEDNERLSVRITHLLEKSHVKSKLNG